MARFLMSPVGELSTNDDGTRRQAIIQRLMPGDPVDFRQESSETPMVGVWVREGQIGYVPSERTGEFRTLINSGRILRGVVNSVGRPVGRDPNAPVGVVLEVLTGSDAAPPSIAKKSKAIGCFGVLGIAVLLAILAGAIGSHNDSSSPTPDPTKPQGKGVSEVAALAACEQAIKGVATHPSSVEFPWLGLATVHDEATGGWAVRRKFTARNSFNLALTYVAICGVDVTGTAQVISTKEAD